MQNSRHLIFAREGIWHLIIALAAAMAATWAWGIWSLPVWLVFLFIAQFFREPTRIISDKPGAVVSPASGKIVYIGAGDNPYIKNNRAIKISIFMNIFSVHSNLIPIGGLVKKCNYVPGKFFNAALDKASIHNEKNIIFIETATGENIVCVQIAGLIARRILSYIKPGDKVTTGQRYGFIRFGSRVDLYLPINFRPKIKLGQKVESGDVIGAM